MGEVFILALILILMLGCKTLAGLAVLLTVFFAIYIWMDSKMEGADNDE